MTTDPGAEPDLRFSNWIKRQLEHTGMTTTDVIGRGVRAKQFSKVTFYRWLNGEHTPGSKNVDFLASVFGADPREAYEAAGLDHLMDMEGDIVTVADPAGPFVARIKARGFPTPVEDRLIAYVRNDIEQRKRALDELLDTVAATQGPATEDQAS